MCLKGLLTSRLFRNLSHNKLISFWRERYNTFCSETLALFISQMRYQLMRLRINQVNFYIIDSHKNQMKTDDMQENWKHTCILQYNLVINNLLPSIVWCHGWSVRTSGSLGSLKTPSFSKKPFLFFPVEDRSAQNEVVCYLKVSQHPMRNNKNETAQSEVLALFLEQWKLSKPQ